MHLMFDGLVRRGQHGTDSPLRLADGAATEAQAEVLFKLLLYLANALVKQTTLQGDVAQQVGPHLAAAHRLGQRSRAGLDAMTTGAAKELMFGHPVADLGQVKDLMDAVGFVMKYHIAPTAGALSGRVMGYYRQPFIRWMTLTPSAFVARLGAAFFT